MNTLLRNIVDEIFTSYKQKKYQTYKEKILNKLDSNPDIDEFISFINDDFNAYADGLLFKNKCRLTLKATIDEYVLNHKADFAPIPEDAPIERKNVYELSQVIFYGIWLYKFHNKSKRSTEEQDIRDLLSNAESVEEVLYKINSYLMNIRTGLRGRSSFRHTLVRLLDSYCHSKQLNWYSPEQYVKRNDYEDLQTNYRNLEQELVNLRQRVSANTEEMNNKVAVLSQENNVLRTEIDKLKQPLLNADDLPPPPPVIQKEAENHPRDTHETIEFNALNRTIDTLTSENEKLRSELQALKPPTNPEAFPPPPPIMDMNDGPIPPPPSSTHAQEIDALTLTNNDQKELIERLYISFSTAFDLMKQQYRFLYKKVLYISNVYGGLINQQGEVILSPNNAKKLDKALGECLHITIDEDEKKHLQGVRNKRGTRIGFRLNEQATQHNQQIDAILEEATNEVEAQVVDGKRSRSNSYANATAALASSPPPIPPKPEKRPLPTPSANSPEQCQVNKPTAALLQNVSLRKVREDEKIQKPPIENPQTEVFKNAFEKMRGFVEVSDDESDDEGDESTSSWEMYSCE